MISTFFLNLIYFLVPEEAFWILLCFMIMALFKGDIKDLCKRIHRFQR